MRDATTIAALLLGLATAACASGPRGGQSTEAAAAPSADGESAPSANDASAAPAGPEKSEEEREAEQIAAIQAALNESRIAVHDCWGRAAKARPDLSGAVVLRLEMGANGATANVSVVSDEPGDPALTECLVSLWRGAEWPNIFAAGDVIQLPPFEFVAPDDEDAALEPPPRAPLQPLGAA